MSKSIKSSVLPTRVNKTNLLFMLETLEKRLPVCNGMLTLLNFLFLWGLWHFDEPAILEINEEVQYLLIAAPNIKTQKQILLEQAGTQLHTQI